MVHLFGIMYMQIPAGKHTMELVAVDWLKDIKRIDHVARRPGCAVQVGIKLSMYIIFSRY